MRNIEQFCPILPCFFCLMPQHCLTGKGFCARSGHGLEETCHRGRVDQIDGQHGRFNGPVRKRREDFGMRIHAQRRAVDHQTELWSQQPLKGDFGPVKSSFWAPAAYLAREASALKGLNDCTGCTAVPQNANGQFLKVEQGRVRGNNLPKTIRIRVVAFPPVFGAHDGVHRPNSLGLGTEFV